MLPTKLLHRKATKGNINEKAVSQYIEIRKRKNMNLPFEKKIITTILLAILSVAVFCWTMWSDYREFKESFIFGKSPEEAIRSGIIDEFGEVYFYASEHDFVNIESLESALPPRKVMLEESKTAFNINDLVLMQQPYKYEISLDCGKLEEGEMGSCIFGSGIFNAKINCKDRERNETGFFMQKECKISLEKTGEGKITEDYLMREMTPEAKAVFDREIRETKRLEQEIEKLSFIEFLLDKKKFYTLQFELSAESILYNMLYEIAPTIEATEIEGGLEYFPDGERSIEERLRNCQKNIENSTVDFYKFFAISLFDESELGGIKEQANTMKDASSKMTARVLDAMNTSQTPARKLYYCMALEFGFAQTVKERDESPTFAAINTINWLKNHQNAPPTYAQIEIGRYSGAYLDIARVERETDSNGRVVFQKEEGYNKIEILEVKNRILITNSHETTRYYNLIVQNEDGKYLINIHRG